ncbi:MAG TPA: lipoyl(octanoyl) transferase LipB [Nitrospira sp.]|nr:lipoyl(octanoyl) transferase LipB [Nitrospira sp.]
MIRRGTLITVSDPISFAEGWRLQQWLHRERREEQQLDTLLLLEHEPVYTLGRRTAPSDVPMGEAALRVTGASVEWVNRGGSVTFHGPGQLVGYPIVRLADFARGVKRYVWLLEEILLRSLERCDIEARRLEGKPGLFVDTSCGPAKIASIGVRVDRGITLHGFSLNVAVDVDRFSLIVPCGLGGIPITSMAQLLPYSVPLSFMMKLVADRFADLFQIEWDPGVVLEGMQRHAPFGSVNPREQRTKEQIHA